ncbi:MFS transporter [Fictibacillus terranigra]|uniref:MFS transporter n=1 Tax=Fictibacillus terranigra TaxID=3058424 RepID=A0ABT8E7T6_9BACL|nr:MFS transporter [Fictibacillus sp. CENA-BCM004]MDN4073973.1 MFS transporter [Fictibacillus sp. CENA-BCM004]
MGSSHPIARIALYICVFLFVFTEVLFSPFYPQFFQKVFGVSDLQFTGNYLFLCRLSVVAASPVWGWLSKKVDRKRLLLIGQAGTGLSCGMMALAVTETQFAVWSLILLLFKSSYLLLYPLLLESAMDQKKVTANYHALAQCAAAGAALASSWLIQLKDPLSVFWWIGGLDLLQALICMAVLSKTKTESRIHKTPIPASASAARKSRDLYFLMKLGITVFTLHFAVTLIRPLFTVYTEAEYGSSYVESSFLFLLPSFMTLAALPVMKKLKSENLRNVYMISGAMVLISILLQGGSSTFVLFTAGRCLFGFFLAICLASLDMSLFQKGKEAGHQYGWMCSFQNLGLLLAPVSVPAFTENGASSVPFWAAGVVLAVHLPAAFVALRRNSSLTKAKAA